MTKRRVVDGLALAGLVLFSACKKDSTGPGGNGTMTLTLTVSSISIVQAANGSVTATIGRGGDFSGDVTITIEGLPANVTATASPSVIGSGSTSSVITINVAAGAVVAATTLTVRARGTGVADRTATLTLTVTSSGGGGGGGGGATTFRLCGQTMIYAAYQDGSGAWMPTAITNNTITANIASGRGAIAYVTSSAATNYSVTVLYMTQAELNTGAINCPVPAATKTLFGSVANVTGLNERADVAMGPTAFASLLAGGPVNFTLNGVVNLTTDLVAARITQTFGGAGLVAALDKGIIRRDLNPAANSALPVLDFNAGESFTPVTRTLTIGNLGADVASVVVTFMTRSLAPGQTSLGIFTDVPGSNTAARQHPTVPNTQAGDLHAYSLNTVPAAGATRSLVTWYREGLDRTVTLGPALNAVTVTTAATAPSVRLRAQYTTQPQYDDAVTAIFQQAAAGTFRFYTLSATRGYLGASNTFDFTIPDFTPLAGWLAVWNLVVGNQVLWGVTATGGNFSSAEGSVALQAARTGNITP